ncbi:SDR family NAD(P)-dependent oxidoreductase [Flavobacterium arcticum]|uniref:SDR family NAD(P)-dependent oxidoreductase n=1 Tax=Flavobacterium arcticum TaxID=1784713 RepID=A0A345H935_9FLAO|nr:SDR family NAD(P)-dependent oxidoreductase [Flavobacterium arcticum]AXG73095.1 SDR family NAD(P)-dependent oxidoreductase [Flavobacterium arcticum]KAF2512886.1 SDR family NAD(P)-dependent oxidoreductase [Flavobacterium arcticum]
MKNQTVQKVWFITGASKGFGLEFVKQLLAKGDAVTATSRSISQLKDATNTKDTNFLPLEVNLIDEQSVANAITETIDKFGRIDYVVNNAGYGIAGSLEELSDKEARQNFDVNVFGSLNVIRQVMPHLRKQQSGHIFNFSSVAGITGSFPGFGIYCATKFAVVGFTEALAVEGKPFGIKATIVLPGYFRTNFLESDSLVIAATQMEEYKEVREIQAMHENKINGNQQGDPVKGVAEIIKTAGIDNAPLYLFLGSDALKMAQDKNTSLHNEVEAWKTVSKATDF